MTKMILARHGETDWNSAGRMQGSVDVPLNERGRGQAQQLADLLADKPLKAIYASPLKRAFATAEAVAERREMDVLIREDLQEINVGEWEGLTREEIAATNPELWQQWRQDPFKSPAPPEGEHYLDFQKRCIDVLDAIAAEHDENDLILVVTHGGVLKAVLSGLLGIPWQSRGIMYFLNCGVTRLRWNPGGRVVIDGFNEASHLSDVQTSRK
ncbi:MAG: histidine phosphatase family protein [Firmicutes bacterium]|nr:histidine phosphatase family protein [Bacillota bacterium]